MLHHKILHLDFYWSLVYTTHRITMSHHGRLTNAESTETKALAEYAVYREASSGPPTIWLVRERE